MLISVDPLYKYALKTGNFLQIFLRSIPSAALLPKEGGVLNLDPT